MNHGDPRFAAADIEIEIVIAVVIGIGIEIGIVVGIAVAVAIAFEVVVGKYKLQKKMRFPLSLFRSLTTNT